MENAIKALLLGAQLVREAQAMFAHAETLIGNARAEGRDISDAELDSLKSAREDALAKFRAQISG